MRHYHVPRERGLSLFLVVSIAFFTLATLLAALIPPEAQLPPLIEVDLGIDTVANEPPPLGEVDAGVGEKTLESASEPERQPEPQPEAEVPPSVPETVPESEQSPEPTPETEQPPPTEPEPQFTVPQKEEPPPKPKPQTKVPPRTEIPSKPRQLPARSEAPPNTGPVGSGLTSGQIGVQGSPGGKVGGRGGGRGDFISTPPPQYDATAKQRGYHGSGTFIIQYENGKIVSVTAVRSTGIPYLDARSIAWISSRWRVKSGTSGAATLPITWQLR